MRPDELARRIRADILRQELRTLLAQMVAAGERRVKQETPVRRGTLRRSVTGRVIRPGELGAVGTNLSYARFVHNGTRPHVIGPPNRPPRQRRTRKDGKPAAYRAALFWPGAPHPVAKVYHPGSKANPFLIRGLDRARPDFERLAQAAGARFWAQVAGG